MKPTRPRTKPPRPSGARAAANKREKRANAGLAPRRRAPARRGRTAGTSTMAEVCAARDLFWQNVIRQILTSLSVEWLNRNRQSAPALPPPDGAAGAPQPEASGGPEDLFDGRLGILTRAGGRIPVAQVFPVLACGIATADAAKLLSMAVECSVFQVRTPRGEVYTLPLSEMRGFHSLTPELMEALEASARRDGDAEDRAAPEGPGTPFGFAAFTSMQRAMRERLHGIGYPQHAPDAPNPYPDE